jgi:hypothetical protein
VPWKNAALAALVVGFALTGCSASAEKTQAPTATKAPAVSSVPAERVVGDTPEELTVATEWADKWCQIHMGDRKDEVLAVMGKPRSTTVDRVVKHDVWFWRDRNYSFQANIDAKGQVGGYASAIPPKLTAEVTDMFSCDHG